MKADPTDVRDALRVDWQNASQDEVHAQVERLAGIVEEQLALCRAKGIDLPNRVDWPEEEMGFPARRLIEWFSLAKKLSRRITDADVKARLMNTGLIIIVDFMGSTPRSTTEGLNG